uniref:Uncharacterized protein n=1 Tax=Arundo donax TaxID=35708 RepID=A0A0A9ACM9_ARUDO
MRGEARLGGGKESEGRGTGKTWWSGRSVMEWALGSRR